MTSDEAVCGGNWHGHSPPPEAGSCRMLERARLVAGLPYLRNLRGDTVREQ